MEKLFGTETFIEKFYPYIIFIMAFIVPLIVKFIRESIEGKRADESLDKAKSKAFVSIDDMYEEKLSKIKESHSSLEEKSVDILKLLEDNESSLKISNLLNFYNEQIKVYQKNTQNRASWSFNFAIVAMFFGLFFIMLGSFLVINKSNNTGEIIALTSLATLGGAISGYIAKTFLDVHKTSLNQLNRYFKEPLINQYILKSQLLTEELEEKDKKILVSKLFEITTEIIHKNSDFN